MASNLLGGLQGTSHVGGLQGTSHTGGLQGTSHTSTHKTVDVDVFAVMRLGPY